MRRAILLANRGLGNVSPNPLVGCVIVNNDRIIGEGFHEHFGQPHAEVNAINSVEDKSQLNTSTLYVNLEPCNHYGKTPPCSELIIKHKIAKVIVSHEDPNPLVQGSGIKKLREGNIDVQLGLLEQDCKYINRRFLTNIIKKRPYIILKWAQTHDGFIAKPNYNSKWISNTLSRRLVHKWRSEEDAVLIGYNTALYDNPQLNVRDWHGRDPLRIIIDKTLSLPKSHILYDQQQKTLILNQIKSQEEENMTFLKTEDGSVGEMVEIFHKQKIGSVMIEGGAKLLNDFIKAKMWDEARVFTSQVAFGEGISAPQLYRSPAIKEDCMGDELGWYYF